MYKVCFTGGWDRTVPGLAGPGSLGCGRGAGRKGRSWGRSSGKTVDTGPGHSGPGALGTSGAWPARHPAPGPAE